MTPKYKKVVLRLLKRLHDEIYAELLHYDHDASQDKPARQSLERIARSTEHTIEEIEGLSVTGT
jgi:hypothetical protein